MMCPSFLARLLAAAALAGTLAGCELLKHNEETATVVNSRILRMPAGEFFDRYGRPASHVETPDGGAAYVWTSSVPEARPGPEALDERICRLHLSVDKDGRIAAVDVLFDAPGLKSTSRCSEIFAAR